VVSLFSLSIVSYSPFTVGNNAELKLFIDAVNDVLEDEGFHLNTPYASTALEAARSLLEWTKRSDDNNMEVTHFSKSLVKHLRNCLPAGLNREKMWRNFHQFRSSKDHLLLWDKFLKESIGKGGPIFFQYVTNRMFGQLIRQHFPLCTPTHDISKSVQDLSFSSLETDALQYSAGYIPRNLMSKVERSAHPNKEELKLCLLDIIESDGLGDEDESGEWLKAVNRGGLNCVTSQMLEFVFAMERVVRGYFRKYDGCKDVKGELLKLVKTNETVDGEWKMVSAEWEPQESQIIFNMVVELWVTMRGFSFASAWMEKWKAEKSKTVQKSQALRKNLNK
jgi:hypothetical protein